MLCVYHIHTLEFSFIHRNESLALSLHVSLSVYGTDTPEFAQQLAMQAVRRGDSSGKDDC
jgi:hypothetical protein